MRIHEGRPASPHAAVAAAAVALGLLAALVAAPADAVAKPKASKSWKTLAKNLRNAAKFEAKADWFASLALAETLEDEEEADEVREEAKEEYLDSKAVTREQYKVRLELADALGEVDGLYAVEIDPADFVPVIDNPWMPLTPGTTRTYEGETEDGTETVEVTVLHETKEILGVTCTVVRDRVYLDGELVEDTRDWFAQDVEGNVWYFGEIALNYEDGELADVEGSWKAGVDGAQPGIVMPAVPLVGDLYRQEFLAGEAEDYAEVLALDASVTVPYGTFEGCLQTFDGTPLEPDANENKFYAQGIGVVLEVDLETGERVELISVTTE